ncbi:MAG TPA: AMP-binding protein, partial [Streptomyces sp.]
PTPSTEVRIAGPAGGALPEGETGELWLRGQALARGYWRDEEATAQAFTGGWFRTGDLAVIRDGRVDVVGRKADSAEKAVTAGTADTAGETETVRGE